MFEKYLICTPGFKNVSENGQITGFQLDVRITYYRGIYASLVEGFDVVVDGEKFPPEAITFSIGAHRFPLTEVAKATAVRWHFGDPATLTIHKPGGLAPGLHDVQVTEKLRISYHAATKKARLSLASSRRKITLVM